MTRSLGLALTLVLVVAGLGVSVAAVYNATHNGSAPLTTSLGGAAVSLFTAVSLLWTAKPGGLDAMARSAERDFAGSPPRDPRAALDILDLSRTVSSLGSTGGISIPAPVVAVVSGPHSAPIAAAPPTASAAPGTANSPAAPSAATTTPAPPNPASITPALLPVGLIVLLLGACSAPLVHQRRLGALHTQAAGVCRTQHLTCRALQPCSESVRTALRDWQAVSVAASKGDDRAETAGMLVAATSEIAAFATCDALLPKSGAAPAPASPSPASASPATSPAATNATNATNTNGGTR